MWAALRRKQSVNWKYVAFCELPHYTASRFAPQLSQSQAHCIYHLKSEKSLSGLPRWLTASRWAMTTALNGMSVEGNKLCGNSSPWSNSHTCSSAFHPFDPLWHPIFSDSLHPWIRKFPFALDFRFWTVQDFINAHESADDSSWVDSEVWLFHAEIIPYWNQYGVCEA